MITLRNLTFSYRKQSRPALLNVNATIGPGIHLLVGENGAGKTTLLHIMAGLLHPSEGECLVDRHPAASTVPAQMGHVFFLEENAAFPAKTILDFASADSGFYPSFSMERFLANLAEFGLTGNEHLRKQSLGNRKKAQLAYVLALGVDILLLDEPTNGLDIQSKATLRRLIASQITEDQTLIVSTHTISELDNLFEGVIAIRNGSLMLAATADTILDHIAFIEERTVDPAALYYEITPGSYRQIIVSDGEDSRIDWEMLYRSLYSPARDRIIDTIMQQDEAIAEAVPEENGGCDSAETACSTLYGPCATPRFSWRRTLDFAGFYGSLVRKQLLVYGAISLILSAFILLPINQIVLTTVYSAISSLLSILVGCAPLILANRGDDPVLERQVPVRPAEKMTFFSIYFLIAIPLVVNIFPALALLLKNFMIADNDSIFVRVTRTTYDFRTCSPYLSLLQPMVVAMVVLYVVKSCRSNRVVKGVGAMIATYFFFSIVGAIYGFFKSLTDSNFGKIICKTQTVTGPAQARAELEDALAFSSELVSSPFMVIFCISLVAITAALIFLTYRQLECKNI